MFSFLRPLSVYFIAIFVLFSFLFIAPIVKAETLLEGSNSNLSGDDNYVGSIGIGFNFDFYGNSYSQSSININGMLNFGSGSSAYSNTGIPNASSPNNFIAPFWDDIITQDFSKETIYYTTTGSAPNRKFIVQWTNMYFYNNPTLQMGTFQVILYEGSNNIQVRYLDLYGNAQAFGNSASIGVENSNGSSGVQYSLNTASLTSGQCLLFSPSDGTYSIDDDATCDEYRLFDPNAPSAPTLTAPDDGVNEEALIPTFMWDEANNTDSYTILIATDANFANITYNQTGITSTSYTPPNPLLSDTLFYWRVQSVNETTTALSEVRTFTTRHAPRLSTFGPSAMVNGSYTTNASPGVTFNITDSVDGHSVQYRIQIDNNSNFGSPEVDYTSGLASTGSTSFTVGQDAGSGSYTVGSAGQQLSNANYYWRVMAIDSIGEESPYTTANSGSIAFRVLAGSPEISDMNAIANNTTATITWTTAQESSSKVEYGRVTTYGFTTTETNTSPRVTSHSVNLTDLTPCSRYFYRVRSKNAASSEKVSTQGTFSTTGCVTTIVEGSEETIVPASGGSVTYTNNNATIGITAPSNFVNESSTTIQINRLETNSVPVAPPSVSLVKDNLYSFTVVTDGSETITEFDEPVIVVFTYGTDIEAQYKESTLDLYKYLEDNDEWESKSCIVDTNANTVTCTLSSFSTYGIMGEENTQQSSGNRPSSSQPGISTKTCSNDRPEGSIDLFQIDMIDTKATLHFTPINNNISEYFISYSLNKDEYMYGVVLPHGPSSGAINYTINELTPNTTYYFQVRAGNGCMPGEWSNQMEVKTTVKNGEQKVYYKNFVAKILSVLPNTQRVLGKTTTKPVKQQKNTNTKTCSYTIAPNDTLWNIAEAKLNNGARYKEIMDLNNMDSTILTPGETIKIACS